MKIEIHYTRGFHRLVVEGVNVGGVYKHIDGWKFHPEWSAEFIFSPSEQITIIASGVAKQNLLNLTARMLK